VEADPKTIGTEDLKHICYATRSMRFEWQTKRFIRTTSCQAYS